MPRKREGLASVKTRLVKEQKQRTERRIQGILQPRPTLKNLKSQTIVKRRILIDFVVGGATRTHRDKNETQTDSSSYSFRCGVIVGVFAFVTLLFGLVLLSGNGNGRQK
jgi:hypothetical protein